MASKWYDRAQTVADELMGTCQSLDAALERFGWEGADNNMEFCNALDDRVFCCCDCGWWDEAGAAKERGGHDLVCGECEPDDE